MFDWRNIPHDHETPDDGQPVCVWYEGEFLSAIYGARSQRFYVGGQHLAIQAAFWMPRPGGPSWPRDPCHDYRVCLVIDGRSESHIAQATSPAGAQYQVIGEIRHARPTAQIGYVQSITATN